MEFSNQFNLLPLGQKIDFNGHQIEIIQKLGAGYTSIVYEGLLEMLGDGDKKRVAIKVFKPSDLPEMNNTFREEGFTLQALMDEELIEDNYSGTVIKIAPLYYGMGDFQGNSYLVMEFIQGEELPAILKKTRILSEKRTLTIAWHFFHLLEILHNQLKQTYIDMKFENLWWSGGEDGQLRVIDLGMLQQIKPDANYIGNPRLDLLRGSIMMFKLVSGRNLMLDVTNLKDFAEPIIEETDMSWGLKELFKKALSRNPEYRYKTATEIKEAFYDLFEYWNLDEFTLVTEVKKLLSGIDELINENDIEKSRNKSYRAKSMMAIFEQKADEVLRADNSELLKNAQDAVEASSYFEFGKELIRGGSYKAAISQLSMGESLAIKQSPFRRWKFLGMIGDELLSTQFTPVLRQQVEEAIERMNADDYHGAYNRITSLKNNISSKGLTLLSSENQIFIGIENARILSSEGNYPAAADLYRDLQNILKQLPSETNSLKDEIGNLDLMAEEMEKLKRTLSEAQKLLQQLSEKIRSQQWNESFELLLKAWSIYPKSPIYIPILKDGMKTALNSKKLDDACRLGHISSFIDESDTELFVLRESAFKLSHVKRLLLQDDIDSAIRECRLISSDSRIYQLINLQLKELLEFYTAKWIKAKNINYLEILFDYLKEYFPSDISWQTDIRKNIDLISNEANLKFKNQIDDLISSIEVRLFIINPDVFGNAIRLLPFTDMLHCYKNKNQELEEIHRNLGNVKKISLPINYRIDEVNQMLLRVDEYSKRLQKDESKAQVQIDNANVRIIEFQKRFENIKQNYSFWLNSIENRLSSQVQSDIRDDIIIAVSTLFIDLHSYIQNIDGNNEQIQKLQSELLTFMDVFDVQGCDLFLKITEKKNEIIDSLNKVENLIRSGNLEQASAEIALLEKRRFSQEQLQPLKMNMFKILQFFDWQNSHMNELKKSEFNYELLKQIKQRIPTGLDNAKWNETEANNYLRRVTEYLNHELKSLIKNPIKPEYLDILKHWSYVQIINQANIEKSAMKIDE